MKRSTNRKAMLNVLQRAIRGVKKGNIKEIALIEERDDFVRTVFVGRPSFDIIAGIDILKDDALRALRKFRKVKKVK